MTDEITTAAEAEARLDEVVEVLSGDDVEARAAMLDALADVAPDLSPEAVETLVPHVAPVVEADGRDRWPGLRFVGDAASTHTDELIPLVEPLVSVCVSPTASPGHAVAAVEAISSLRPAADERLDTLVRALVDDIGEDPSERRFDGDDGNIAEGLGLLALKIPSAVVPVAEEISLLAATGDDWTRQCATVALLELVEAGVPLDRDVVNRLIGRLDDDEPQTRLRAAEAVVPAVEQCPRTPSDAFDLPATLARLAADDPDERIRLAATKARAALLDEGGEGSFRTRTDSTAAADLVPPMRRVSPSDASAIDQDALVQFRDADPDPDAVQYYLELDAVAEPYVGVAVAETDDGETAIGVALPADEGVWAERFGTTVTDTPETNEASTAGDEGEDSTVRHRDDGAEASTDESGTLADRRPDPSTVDAPYVDVDYDDLVEEEVIGIGGNADVMKATLPAADGDSDGDVTLAIKRPRMQGTLHADAVERLLSEAETWDKLDDHDHVVSVVDYGAEPLPWIAMEHVDGGDLSERAGDLNFEQALWTAVAITKGVRHAHRRGVVHLDLKPTNVLFREVEGAWDVPKIADWGLSKHLLDHSKSVDGLSPQYAAPEQFDTDRGPADDLTDVYQVGALLYELFTGQPPFDGDPAGAMHGALHETPTPPSEVADLPPALDDVLLTALAKSRDDRYEDVLYLRDALRELQDLDGDTERGELPDPGDIVVGTVDEIVDFGAFVDFKDHAGRGLVHVSEIANGWSKAVSDHVTEGERVVAKVVGVDEDAGHVDLSLTEVD